jgi:hypothetical protein
LVLGSLKSFEEFGLIEKRISGKKFYIFEMESENRKSLSENVFEEGRNIYGSGENEIRSIVQEEEFKYRISNPKRNL